MAVAEQTVVSQNATVVLAETGNENKKEVHTDRGLDTLPSLVAGSPPPLNGKGALPGLDTLAIVGTSGVLVGEEADNFPP